MRNRESETKTVGINQEKSQDQWVGELGEMTQKSLKKDTFWACFVSKQTAMWREKKQRND